MARPGMSPRSPQARRRWQTLGGKRILSRTSVSFSLQRGHAYTAVNCTLAGLPRNNKQADLDLAVAPPPPLPPSSTAAAVGPIWPPPPPPPPPPIPKPQRRNSTVNSPRLYRLKALRCLAYRAAKENTRRERIQERMSSGVGVCSSKYKYKYLSTYKYIYIYSIYTVYTVMGLEVEQDTSTM